MNTILKKIFGFFVWIFFLWIAPLHALGYTEASFPPELEGDLSAGASSMYHLDFEAMQFHLSNAIAIKPEHPAAYFFQAMGQWYRLTYDSLENNNSNLENKLDQYLNQTIEVSRKYSGSKKFLPVSSLYWGASLGAKGWYFVSRGQWVRAYFSGKKGYSLVRKVVDSDPELYEAYLGLGMYEYYAATLGPALKILASFFVRGDREKAMRYLRLAEMRSRYVRLESAYFMWNAFMDEGRLGEALKQSNKLNEIFPHSPFFNWCEIQTLFYQKDWHQVLLKGNKYIHKALEKNETQGLNTYTLLLGKVYFHCGAASFNLGKLDDAKVFFNKAVQSPSEFSGWKIVSFLALGMISDSQGLRSEAVHYYEQVLSFPKVWEVQKFAKKCLKSPYFYSAEKEMRSPLQTWKRYLDE